MPFADRAILALRSGRRRRLQADKRPIHSQYNQPIEGIRRPTVTVRFQQHRNAPYSDISVTIASIDGFMPLAAKARQYFERDARVVPAANKQSILITGWKSEHQERIHAAVPGFQRNAGVRI